MGNSWWQLGRRGQALININKEFNAWFQCPWQCLPQIRNSQFICDIHVITSPWVVAACIQASPLHPLHLPNTFGSFPGASHHTDHPLNQSLKGLIGKHDLYQLSLGSVKCHSYRQSGDVRNQRVYLGSCWRAFTKLRSFAVGNMWASAGRHAFTAQVICSCSCTYMNIVHMGDLKRLLSPCPARVNIRQTLQHEDMLVYLLDCSQFQGRVCLSVSILYPSPWCGWLLHHHLVHVDASWRMMVVTMITVHLNCREMS